MSEEKKLNGTVIVTYRCNARCSMCNRYKAPSKPEEEISIETIKKLPKMYFTNITGGEPFIRTDLKDIVEIPRGNPRLQTREESRPSFLSSVKNIFRFSRSESFLYEIPAEIFVPFRRRTSNAPEERLPKIKPTSPLHSTLSKSLKPCTRYGA